MNFIIGSLSAILFVINTFIFYKPCFEIYPSKVIDTVICNPLNTNIVLATYIVPDSISVLNLKWEKIYSKVPASWDINLCDNKTCHYIIPAIGKLYPIYPGTPREENPMKLIIHNNNSTGDMEMKFLIYQDSNFRQSDTLIFRCEIQ